MPTYSEIRWHHFTYGVGSLYRKGSQILGHTHNSDITRQFIAKIGHTDLLCSQDSQGHWRVSRKFELSNQQERKGDWEIKDGLLFEPTHVDRLIKFAEDAEQDFTQVFFFTGAVNPQTSTPDNCFFYDKPRERFIEVIKKERRRPSIGTISPLSGVRQNNFWKLCVATCPIEIRNDGNNTPFVTHFRD